MSQIPQNKPEKPVLNIYKLELKSAARAPEYDVNTCVVVVAEDARDARRQASTVASGEGAKVWLNPKHSSCRQVNLRTPGIVCVDNLNG